jgi:hypothetical protein
MNVRLQYDLEMLAGIWYEEQLQLNVYNVSLNLLTLSRDQKYINVAMERLRCFVHSELANAVYINSKYNEQATLFAMMGINIVTLPEEPVDQIIGMMLYCKLNAIMENVMQITQINIASTLGDDVWYMHDEEDALGPFAADNWWHQANTAHDDLELEELPQNVVRVRDTGWPEYGLMWPERPVENANSTVLYPKFPKHEKQ